jgi:hypothetical protein
MNPISATTADSVLQLLRLLPPRERLRVVVQALPELERELPVSPSSPDFWPGVDLRVLAERQGAQPITDWAALLGGWPEDEPIDDFIAAVREWRRSSPAEVHVE